MKTPLVECYASHTKFLTGSKRTLLPALGWFLVLGSVGLIAASLFFESSVRKALEGAAVPAGVLLALAGHVFTQARSIADTEEKRSLFNLDGFKAAFEHAHTLLSDGNNVRTKWIEAARCLGQGEELAKAVTAGSHKRVLELEHLKYRGAFHHVLADKSADFFYGVPPLLYATLDEAAAASSRRTRSHGRTIVGDANDLDEAAIHTVWLAAKWPDDYVDPVGERFQENELGRVTMLFPELHRYLEHKRTWSSVGGNLSRREGNEH